MSINRRNFIKLLGGATLLTVVPRRVLGGPNHVAPSDQLTKGIIGVGGIGKSKYHFTSDERCRLVAVCDVDRRHLRSAVELGHKKFNETLQAYEDYRDLIADPNVDIVHIATPGSFSSNCFRITSSRSLAALSTSRRCSPMVFCRSIT